MFVIALIVLPGVTFAASLDKESHYCSAAGEKVTCLSLDPMGVAVLTEAETNMSADAVCNSWGPLTHKYGLYRKSDKETFTIGRGMKNAKIQMRNKPPMSLDAVYPHTTKSLAAVFSMDQPKWEIHFEPHKPNRVRVVGDKGVIEGRVAEGYPYTITWGNEEGQGNAMLVQVPSDDPEPVHEHVILAEYQPREGQAERFSLFHLRNKHVHTKEKFWTGKRFAGWLEDVKKHRLEPIDASDWGSVSARAEDTEE